MDRMAVLADMLLDDRLQAVQWLFNRIEHTGGSAQTDWNRLQVSPIAGQTRSLLRRAVHFQMLRQSWHDCDFRESLGQLFRMALVPLAHMTGRLPWANSGRRDASAFMPRCVSRKYSDIGELLQRYLGVDYGKTQPARKYSDIGELLQPKAAS